jgi:hypothetical protein
LDFVPLDLEFVPSGLDFAPKKLDFLPGALRAARLFSPSRAKNYGGMRTGTP